jgi:hypothetical protein
MNNRKNEVAPCGILCAACLSFNKTCLGCASESKDKGQKRKSKWGCKIRQCCYEKKTLDSCAYCEYFPCAIINKKLLKSHDGDKRFNYRREVPDNLEKIKSLGINEFIKLKKKEYECKSCGGIVFFYYNKCSQCGKEV